VTSRATNRLSAPSQGSSRLAPPLASVFYQHALLSDERVPKVAEETGSPDTDSGGSKTTSEYGCMIEKPIGQNKERRTEVWVKKCRLANAGSATGWSRWESWRRETRGGYTDRGWSGGLSRLAKG
jgi:hypothetical protein